MGQTTYAKLKKVLENFEENKIFTIDELRVLIIKNVGGDERTISACLRIMAETQLTKDIGDCRFKIL